MSSPIEVFSSRVRRWTSRPDGFFSFCCPAHDDHNPSGWARECDDGSLLVGCHAGCHYTQIVAVVGLELADLHAQKPGNRVRTRYNRDAVLRCLKPEIYVVGVAAGYLAEKLPEEAERLRNTQRRLSAALEVIE